MNGKQQYPSNRVEWAEEARRLDSLIMAEKLRPPYQQRRHLLDRLWAARHVARQAADYAPIGIPSGVVL